MTTYYNEHEPFAAQWLRNLSAAGHISGGTVDERDIQTIVPAELAGFERVHFFAGIGGWDYALRLAGWPEGLPVWTGSCPCQPFSCAGKGKGEKDERHLWPEFFRLIKACRPGVVIGEQVASAIGHGWLDGVFADLEGEGYACGAAVLPACSVGAPHKRDRLFWVAHNNDIGRLSGYGEAEDTRGEVGIRGGPFVGDGGEDDSSLAQDPLCIGRGGRGERNPWEGIGQIQAAGLCGAGSVSDTERPQEHQEPPESDTAERERGAVEPGGRSVDMRPWSRYSVVLCADGKARRIAAQSEVQPVVDGLPECLEPAGPEEFGEEAYPLVKGSPGRVGMLRGAGNAIVPQVAAEFIAAFMESVGITGVVKRSP